MRKFIAKEYSLKRETQDKQFPYYEDLRIVINLTSSGDTSGISTDDIMEQVMKQFIELDLEGEL